MEVDQPISTEAETTSTTAPTPTTPQTFETTVTSSEATSVTSSEDTSTSEAAATMLALGQMAEAAPCGNGSGDNNAEEKVVYMMMDENQQFDPSQTFYIDSNSLANGDLSKLVVAAPSATSEAAPATVHAADPTPQQHEGGTVVSVDTAPKVDSTEAANAE